MAKIITRGAVEYGAALKMLELTWAGNNDILEKAARAGANPVADEIRKRLRSLPEDEYRFLGPGEVFSGIPEGQKQDLLASLGVTPADNHNGFVNVKIGFDGYGSFPTRAYPNGIPNALIARATESGSSVRKKTPFIRPAVNSKKKEAVEEMDKYITSSLKKIFK